MNTAQAVQEKPEAKSNKVYKIALTGLFAALSYVVFTFLQFKIYLPGGDATSIHLGNAVCVLGALLLGGFYGGFGRYRKAFFKNFRSLGQGGFFQPPSDAFGLFFYFVKIHFSTPWLQTMFFPCGSRQSAEPTAPRRAPFRVSVFRPLFGPRFREPPR